MNKKPKKIKLDMSETIKALEKKTVRNPHWGTGIYGGVNIGDKY